jgi:hypothetical protein
VTDPYEMQTALARKFDVEARPPLGGEKVGISKSVRDGLWPIHGLRHPPAADTSGWYIWAGEYSAAADFFVPLHVDHLSSWCSAAVPYLGLPPGWRFLLAPDHEDVWFDESLLD